MPKVAAPAKVLVTGANGYVAVWVVRTLLDRGYSVRSTVRAESKGSHLLRLFKDEVESGRFELVVIADFTAPGAFDDAVKGINAIEHVAAPVSMDADDPNENVEPAVKGTVGILESAHKHGGPELKRIVITSSCAAVANRTAEGLLDENSWNEESVVEIREKGRAANQMSKYSASKTLAEKAAWDFVSKNKSTITWDLVTLCPPAILGPPLQEVSTLSSVNTSVEWFYNALFGENSPFKVMQIAWIDVRDVAEAHVLSLEVPEAGGKRFILSNESFIWQDWLDAISTFKSEIPGLSVATGTPGSGKDFPFKARFDNTKARTVLGLKFRDKATAAKDMIEDFKARGWKLTSEV